LKRVSRGGFVFLEGEPAASLNLLADARVKVIRETEDGQEVILRLIESGEIFGAAGSWASRPTRRALKLRRTQPCCSYRRAASPHLSASSRHSLKL
jgi:CRP-like cAMP-binding protein